MKKTLLTVLAVILPVALVYSGCGSSRERASTIVSINKDRVAATNKDEGVAIYLVKRDGPVPEMQKLNLVELADPPIIAADEILAYYWDTHELEISEPAFLRIKQDRTARTGPVFIVCVNKKPVYWGVFWTLLSSDSPKSVYMVRPFTPPTAKHKCILELGLGHFPNILYGKDPRNDASIYAALRIAGKLKKKSPASVASSKAYRPDSFAIHLTKGDVPVTKMSMYHWPEPADQPVIAESDILSYNRASHEMKLAKQAYKRLTQLSIPVAGRSFIACSGKSPMFLGALWAPVSSIPYNGIVICMPPPLDAGLPADTIRLDYGYPPMPNPKPDFRDNSAFLELLQKTGKLTPSLVLYTYPTAANAGPGNFAIYLAKDNVIPSRMELFNQIELASTPILGADDIIAYEWATHKILLTTAAYERVRQLTARMSDLSFVACVGNMPVYWGAFWGPNSSMFDGAVIGAFPYITETNTIGISFGGNFTSRGPDPRNSPLIRDALTKSGKLNFP